LADVFNFCTERFGPLHYLQDNHLKLIQTTAFNFGGGAAGKEILAHEIIHQWWGA